MAMPQYVQYVNSADAGLKKSSVVDGFEFDVQYKPHEYIVLLENSGKVTRDAMTKRLVELKGTAWFNIAIKRVDNQKTPLRYGISSLEEYNARLNYFLTEAQGDIWLVYGRDTIRPQSYLFENNYNLTPQETMVVGFALPGGDDHPKKQMQLSYNDRVFKTGIIKANFSETSLKHIPILKEY